MRWALVAAAFSAPAAADPVDIGTAVEQARSVPIVIVGEVHDDPQHHLIQARFAGVLAPTALVFEQVPAKRETRINTLRDAGASRRRLADAMDWDASGWPDFNMYADILDAAPQALVFGGGAEAEDVRRAFTIGAAAAFGPTATRFGLDRALPADEQSAREARQMAAHCDAFPIEMAAEMVEAQRFRDAMLADAILRARSRTSGQVLVITGNGHAHVDWGIPAVLAVALPEIAVLSIGQIPGPAAGAEPYDLWIETPARIGAIDPCEAFRGD